VEVNQMPLNMEQQTLWIIAALGAGCLIGVFWKMKGGFGPVNLRIVGIVLVAVLTALLALAKSNDLTAAMGILGAIVGYLFGAKTNGRDKSNAGSSVEASGSEFGDNARIAGRDINEMIETMHGEVQEIKDSVINQFPKIAGALDHAAFAPGQVTEFLFFTSFLTIGEPINESAKVVRELQPRGWSLISTTSSYAGRDGLMMVFRRVRPPEPEDQKIDDNQYLTRVYHGIDEVEMDYE
jgi:hypothetical protein